jgi:anti-sigma-K factor RskA
MSTDLHTLSGAYAIDALSEEEARQFDRHLEECPACREEVRELRAAAAKMGAAEALAPPPALKARVLSAADQMPQLPPRVTPTESTESVRKRRWSAKLVAAAAAVILAVSGGVAVVESQRGDNQSVVASTVAQVFQADDARTKTVQTDHGSVTVATSPSLGRMAVRTDDLRALSGKRVYQLWAVHGGTPTSAGVIANPKAGAAMAMPGEGTTVAITVEPEGGSEQPTTAPFVTVDPRSV